MFCNHCGKELDDTTLFCQNCGQKVNDAPSIDQKAPVADAPQSSPATAAKQPKRNWLTSGFVVKGKVVRWIVVALIIPIIVVIVAIATTGNDLTGTPAQPFLNGTYDYCDASLEEIFEGYLKNPKWKYINPENENDEGVTFEVSGKAMNADREVAYVFRFIGYPDNLETEYVTIDGARQADIISDALVDTIFEPYIDEDNKEAALAEEESKKKAEEQAAVAAERKRGEAILAEGETDVEAKIKAQKEFDEGIEKLREDFQKDYDALMSEEKPATAPESEQAPAKAPLRTLPSDQYAATDFIGLSLGDVINTFGEEGMEIYHDSDNGDSYYLCYADGSPTVMDFYFMPYMGTPADSDIVTSIATYGGAWATNNFPVNATIDELWSWSHATDMMQLGKPGFVDDTWVMYVSIGDIQVQYIWPYSEAEPTEPAYTAMVYGGMGYGG